jgi:hypothetical protein
MSEHETDHEQKSCSRIPTGSAVLARNSNNLKSEGVAVEGPADSIPLTLYRLNLIYIIYTNLVHTSHETHYVSATEPNRLMLFGETVAVYCENRAEHKIHVC